MEKTETMASGATERSTRLNAETWERAALEAIAELGLPGVAVEPLAKKLGVTKGSFYWHFADREALLHAALKRWEKRSTDDVIAWLEKIAQEKTLARIRAWRRACPDP